jgi:predicted dehydrogenase
VKIRRTLIGGSQKMIVYDDLEPSEKIKIYDKGITIGQNSPDNVYQMLINYRSGDMWAPKLDGSEALKIEASHFIECIEKSLQPETSGESGLRIVRMLEAATESLSRNGQPVNL